MALIIRATRVSPTLLLRGVALNGLCSIVNACFSSCFGSGFFSGGSAGICVGGD